MLLILGLYLHKSGQELGITGRRVNGKSSDKRKRGNHGNKDDGEGRRTEGVKSKAKQLIKNVTKLQGAGQTA